MQRLAELVSASQIKDELLEKHKIVCGIQVSKTVYC